MITPESLAASGTEFGMQQAVFCWAAQCVGKYPQLKFMFHIPNGEQRSGFTGARLKAGGVRPGVPDIFIPIARHGLNGLFIELKKTGGKISDSQKTYLEFLTTQGYGVCVAWNYETARDTIIHYLEGIENVD